MWVGRCMLCATVSWHIKPVWGNIISTCMCTLWAVVHSENRNWCGNTVSIVICTLHTTLHREKWKWCGNTVSTHYALCLQCYIVKQESGVWQHCQYTYMHSVCRATSWNKKVVCGNTPSTHIRTLFAVLHRETIKWCVATLTMSVCLSPKFRFAYWLLRN